METGHWELDEAGPDATVPVSTPARSWTIFSVVAFVVAVGFMI